VIVESASWRKSSRSVGNGACVEVGGEYRKSSRSTGALECVEVGAASETVVGVRDTKAAGDRNRVTLQVPAWSWRQFTESIKSS
jgi:Domain of unknown function (DUF397)